ncbi:MAG: hypothetical protein ACREHG_04215 [Candidatus Saccharimonadales bacterium]
MDNLTAKYLRNDWAENAIRMRFGPDPELPGQLLTAEWEDDIASVRATQRTANRIADANGLVVARVENEGTSAQCTIWE